MLAPHLRWWLAGSFWYFYCFGGCFLSGFLGTFAVLGVAFCLFSWAFLPFWGGFLSGFFKHFYRFGVSSCLVLLGTFTVWGWLSGRTLAPQGAQGAQGAQAQGGTRGSPVAPGGPYGTPGFLEADASRCAEGPWDPLRLFGIAAW